MFGNALLLYSPAPFGAPPIGGGGVPWPRRPAPPRRKKKQKPIELPLPARVPITHYTTTQVVVYDAAGQSVGGTLYQLIRTALTALTFVAEILTAAGRYCVTRSTSVRGETGRGIEHRADAFITTARPAGMIREDQLVDMVTEDELTAIIDSLNRRR